MYLFLYRSKLLVVALRSCVGTSTCCGLLMYLRGLSSVKVQNSNSRHGEAMRVTERRERGTQRLAIKRSSSCSTNLPILLMDPAPQICQGSCSGLRSAQPLVVVDVAQCATNSLFPAFRGTLGVDLVFPAFRGTLGVQLGVPSLPRDSWLCSWSYSSLRTAILVAIRIAILVAIN